MKVFACVVGAIVLAITSVVPAAAIDITFDDLTSAGNPLVTLLDDQGYRFTGAFRTIDSPGTTFVSNGSAVYLAQPADLPGITLSRVDGGPFALYELTAAGLLTPSAGGAQNAEMVRLLGLRVGGAMVTQSFSLLGSGFTHLAVPTTWSDLQLVTLSGLTSSGLSGALAIDDVGVGSGPDSSVAEPATLLLFVTTALGVGVALRHRRRRAAPTLRRAH